MTPRSRIPTSEPATYYYSFTCGAEHARRVHAWNVETAVTGRLLTVSQSLGSKETQATYSNSRINNDVEHGCNIGAAVIITTHEQYLQ